MVEAVLRAAGPYSLRLTAGTSTWTARLAGERWASAQQLQDGRVVVRASDELAVDDARFMLALDDDTSEFHRRFARDPLLGPTVQRLRGMRTRRKATVTHAVIRAVAGQLIQASKALAIERAIIRGVRRGSADTRGARRPLSRSTHGVRARREPRRDAGAARPRARPRRAARTPTMRSADSSASGASGRGRSASSRCRGSAATTPGSSTTWVS